MIAFSKKVNLGLKCKRGYEGINRFIVVWKDSNRNKVSLLHRMADTSERKGSIEESLGNRGTWMIVAETTGAFIIVILATIGNVILCLAIYRCRVLRKIQNYYIFALAMLFSFWRSCGDSRKMAIWWYALSDSRHLNLLLRVLLCADFDTHSNKSLC